MHGGQGPDGRGAGPAVPEGATPHGGAGHEAGRRRGAPHRRASGVSRRTTRRVTAASVVAGLVLLAAVAWAWRPAVPLDAAGRTTTADLRVGDAVPVPELAPGARLVVEDVRQVRRCDGRWWPDLTGVLAGPVVRVDVTLDADVPVSEVYDLVTSWSALDAWGDAYAGQSACECDGSCEVEPRRVDGAWRFHVLLFTGVSFSEVASTGVPGRLLVWDV